MFLPQGRVNLNFIHNKTEKRHCQSGNGTHVSVINQCILVVNNKHRPHYMNSVILVFLKSIRLLYASKCTVPF